MELVSKTQNGIQILSKKIPSWVYLKYMQILPGLFWCQNYFEICQNT